MKVSTKGRYALRMMVDLAVHDSGDYISLRDVAERQGISMKYMEQIVSLLTRSGLLDSVRGPQGGYKLTRPAQAYTVGDILRATEGELALVSCMSGPENTCPRADTCTTLEVWGGMQRVVDDYVDSVTLADLARAEQEKLEQKDKAVKG